MKILAIGAHADDIEMSCAGTLIKAVKAGHRVRIIVMSRSDYKNYDGKTLRTTAQVKTEQANACRIMGIKECIVYPFKTKEVPHDSKSIERVNREMDQFKPDVIITHWPHDTHQDHVNTSKVVMSAARYQNSILFFEPVMPSGRSYHDFSREFYIDISDVYARKKEVIRAHKSQHKKYGEAWVEAILAKDRERGFEIGTQYAEAYQVMRWEWKL